MTDFYSLKPDEQEKQLRHLAEEALQSWDMTITGLDLIKYRENAVYRIKTESNIPYVLRIHRPGYHTDNELHSEAQWIKALEEYGIDVPVVVPTNNNELFSVVKVDSVPEARQVDIFEWIDGEQLGSVEEGINKDPKAISNIYHTIGNIAARLHNQATSWQLPENFTRHAWDVDGLVGDNPFWGRFWEFEKLTAEQLNLIQDAREKVKQGLKEYGQTPDLYSMIHADFVSENLLLEGEKVRLIDFDDAGFGWHLFDLATVLYFIQDEDYYSTAYKALIDGYRENRDLSDEQLEYMPLFMMARGFTYMGWIHTRPETDTAQEMAEYFTDTLCEQAENYLVKN